LSSARSTTTAPPRPRLRLASRLSAIYSPGRGTTTERTRAVIAVGTALAGGPPRRSQRALLTHWAPASGTNAEAHVREGMHHASRRQPPGRQAVHALPVQAGALAAAPQLRLPVPCHLGAERRHRLAVAGHGVVGAVPAHHAAQPPPLLRDRLMPALPQLVFDLRQLRPHPLRDRDAPHPKTPVPHLRADMREAEEVERLRFPGAPLLPVRGGEPPELDQPRLAGVQLQPELREPLAQVVQEPARILVLLETHDEVVREPHDDHLAARHVTPPPVGPQVEDIVQVNVRQQRRNRRPLRRTLRSLRP